MSEILMESWGFLHLLFGRFCSNLLFDNALRRCLTLDLFGKKSAMRAYKIGFDFMSKYICNWPMGDFELFESFYINL